MNLRPIERVRLPAPCLMLVTEPMERRRLVRVVRGAVAGGVNIIQLRDRTCSLLETISLASLLKLAAPGVPVLINNGVLSVRGASANGVHLSEAHPPLSRAALSRRGLLIGRSVHSTTAARRAACDDADYLVVGTIFESRSHPGAPPAGTGLIRAIRTELALPLIAIGGITPDNLPDCLDAGASGVAVLSRILLSAHPEYAAREYRIALDRASVGLKEA